MERSSEQEEYRKAIRRCMADFAHAVRNPDWTPQVTPDDAYDSLRVAVAACSTTIEMGADCCTFTFASPSGTVSVS